MYFGVTKEWPDFDILQYVKEWDDTEYARAMLYGILTTCAIGNLNDDLFEFFVPLYGESGKYISAISFLCAVRKPHHDLQDPCLKFPPRYSHKSGKDEDDLSLPEVMECFSREGELPKIFTEIEVYDDVEHDYAAIAPLYLRSAVYIGVKGHVFTQQGLDFLKAVLKEAKQLEVLMINDWGTEGVWETEFFDEFIAYLCSFPRFFLQLSIVQTSFYYVWHGVHRFMRELQQSDDIVFHIAH